VSRRPSTADGGDAAIENEGSARVTAKRQCCRLPTSPSISALVPKWWVANHHKPEVESVIDQPAKIQFEVFLYQHRVAPGQLPLRAN